LAPHSLHTSRLLKVTSEVFGCKPKYVSFSPRYRNAVAALETINGKRRVDVVIHSYRHRIRNAAGDPRYAPIEAQLAALPKIGVPTIVIHGADDEVNPPQKSEGHQRFFTSHYERRVFENVGHNPPQEAPEKFTRAVLDLCGRT
jgi:pimeloyl-ACP methyl ester carboxylesterase